MKILALEFSSPLHSVAVWSEGGVRGRSEERGTRHVKPFAQIDAALKQAGVTREDIDCIAVGLGPGSHAGIRIATAIAQGWQLARGTKLIGLGSADCAAQQFAAQGDAAPFSVVIDAQRDEFFAARYAIKDRRAHLTEGFRLMTDADWARQRAGERFIRPDVLEHGPAWLALPPEAATLARLAAQATEFVPGHALEPVYLRKAEFVKAPPPRFPMP